MNTSAQNQERERIEKICSDITAERAAQSSALSTQTRAISLGALALVWLLLGGTQQALNPRLSVLTDSLLLIGFFCVLALTFDFLQYVLALIETELALRESKKAKAEDEAGYDDGSGLRFASNCFFYAKLIVTFITSVWLLILILVAL